MLTRARCSQQEFTRSKIRFLFFQSGSDNRKRFFERMKFCCALARVCILVIWHHGMWFWILFCFGDTVPYTVLYLRHEGGILTVEFNPPVSYTSTWWKIWETRGDQIIKKWSHNLATGRCVKPPCSLEKNWGGSFFSIVSSSKKLKSREVGLYYCITYYLGVPSLFMGLHPFGAWCRYSG